jgi:hypothetical protein
MGSAEDLAQSVVEQLSEDETLRGDELTDEGFTPLFDWLTEAALAYARKLQTDPTDDPAAAMRDYGVRLKKVMQTAVATAEAGKVTDGAELLDFDVYNLAEAQLQLTKLPLSEKAAVDDNAVQIAQFLQAVLQTK